jgi:glycosyltransferase involved in cell wall biosynthesis
MRVAVDARMIYSPSRRGTGKNLIDLYSTLAAQQPGWEFVMFFQSNGVADPFERFPHVRAHRIDIRGDRLNLWQDVRLPLAARACGADLLHCPANTSPRLSPTPVVVTIHDLIPLEMAPDDGATRRWGRRVRRAARIARRIITPSHYSRRTIVSQLKMPEEKITVNYWAPDRNCQRVDDPDVLAATRRKFGVPDNFGYIVAFGAEDPRKNTATIIDAWGRLAPGVRERSVLLVVGLQPSALNRMRALAAQRIVDRSCLLHGFADEADISPLLSGATALCYPSKSEGFGLPILDAFVCGTPIITSLTTSLPEVAGDAALLVDPADSDAIARAMEQVLSSEALRRQLREKGLQRLGLFSWDRCARTAGEIFEAVAGNSLDKETDGRLHRS